MINMFSRRQFLQITGAGAADLLAGGLPSLANIEDAHAASNPQAEFVPDLEIALKASPSEFPILPGNPTSVWSYRAQLLKGEPASLNQLEGTYLGPNIRAHTGQKVRIRFSNEPFGCRKWPMTKKCT